MNRKCFIILLLAAMFGSCTEKQGPDKPSPDDGGGSGTTSSLTVRGSVKDENGNPYVGCVVSDGYKSVATDEKGEFSFEKYRYASYVQCSIPSDAVIATGGEYNIPLCHFQRLQSSKKIYNFVYKRQEKETRFRMLALGDPQVKSDSRVEHFEQTAVLDIRQYLKDTEKLPTYAITLGDNVENSWGYFGPIASSYGKTGIPVFSTIGNHDHDYTCETDALSRQKYEAVFGPSNFSFNRGDVHFVSMDNVAHRCGSSSNYALGYEKWQLEWLKSDLALVPKTMKVVLTVHIPSKAQDPEVMNLLSGFSSAMILCGHTHKIQNTYDTVVNGKTIVQSAVGSTGAPWKALGLSDGCLRGYKVFEFDGPEVEREVYKTIGYVEPHQLRMYRTMDFPGFTTSDGNYISFSKTGENIIAFNAYNAKDGWSYELWEDGVRTSTTPIRSTSYDAWGKWYLYTQAGTDSDIGDNTHVLFFQLSNPSAAEVKIVVTDEFGQSFSQTKFTTKSYVPTYDNFTLNQK